MRKPSFPAPKQGFTLIELLVVVSIIALLVSILLPALSRARESAKVVMCMVSLKQWGYCSEMYLADNDRKFWPGTNEGIQLRDPERNRYVWVNTLRPYYQDAVDLRLCPSANRPTEGGIGSKSVPWLYDDWSGADDLVKEYSGSYGNNTACQGYDIPGAPRDNEREINFVKGDMKNAHDVPLFSDAITFGTYLFSGAESGFPVPSPPPVFEGQTPYGSDPAAMYSGWRVCVDRHSGRINVVFADYSIRKVGLKGLWKLKWNKVFDTQNMYAQGLIPWPEWMADFPDK